METPQSSTPGQAAAWPRPSFGATGGQLFGLYLSNLLLKMVTLGLYAPWAKVKVLKFTAQSTQVEGRPLEFHGTGWEVFKGRAIVYGGFALFIGWVVWVTLQDPAKADMASLLIYPIFFALFPFIYLGAWRYRLSRLSYNQIHFGLASTFMPFAKQVWLDLLWTLLSLGIYGPVMAIRMHRYVFNHIYLGSYRFASTAESKAYFKLYWKGWLLSVITLGIYIPWFVAGLLRYKASHLTLNGQPMAFLGSGKELMGHYTVSLLLLICTLGLYYPWMVARLYRFFIQSAALSPAINLAGATQAQVSLQKAFGEEAADYFDIGL